MSVSLALLLGMFGSLVPLGGSTRTLLMSEPVAVGSIVPLTVKLTRWPLARLSPLHVWVTTSYVPTEGVKTTSPFARAGGSRRSG